MSLKERLIVALDVSSIAEAKPLLESLSPYVGCFKVGLQILTSVGASEIVRVIHESGGKVFLDGKFHDIPNTMAAAAKIAASLNVKMFNVHASAGLEAMQLSVQNKGNSSLLAVTVLTAVDEATCQLIYGTSIEQTVLRFANEACKAGVDGLVCSPQDLVFINSQKHLRGLLKVTPGVRPSWAEANDQKRFVTPGEAIRAGATALVIGRPITNPPKSVGTPVDAVRRILDEICLEAI